MDLVWLIGLFFLFLALRVPISFALVLSSLVILIQLDLPLQVTINQIFANINTFTLLAVPFFLFLGRLLNEGGLTEKMVDFADTTVGHIRGGLGHINVFVSMIFASLSGSSSADTASVGAVMIPAMLKAGYNGPYTVAITAASSTLGNIIPPSIIMVIYGSFGQISIGALFLAGVVPGILIGLTQMGYTYMIALKYGYGGNPRRPLREMGITFYHTSPALVIPVLVLGGIIGGLFTPTEAASIAVVYAFILAMFVYRKLRWKGLPSVLSEAVIDFAVPIFAISCAGIFGWLISYLGAPEIIENFILSFTDSYYGIFACLILFLLLMGTFLSALTGVVIFMPIIQHLGNLANVDPIHLGVSVIMALACGLITPPYGICILIASQIGRVNAGLSFLAVLPLVGITVGIIFLGMVFPDLFLFLPKLVMPEVFVK